MELVRRPLPILVRKLHDLGEFFGDEVLASLGKVYPASVLGWAKSVEWRKSDVPLADIQMARRPGGRDQGKVEGIAQALDGGKQMDRVVLVQTPGNDKYEIADGYHRTLAFDRAGRTNIPAYVGKVSTDEGPWQREMHDAKLNKAAPVLVVHKDAPTATDVHVDVPLGEAKPKRKRKKGDPVETSTPELSVLKADDEARVVYGIVLEPDVEDSQGDVVSKEDVEIAAHRYLYQQGLAIGDQHAKMAPETVRPVESYIAPCDFSMGGQVVKAGSWVLAAHVPDDNLWEQVKKGHKGAWSVGGSGRRSPLPPVLVRKFDESELRDDHGRWSGGAIHALEHLGDHHEATISPVVDEKQGRLEAAVQRAETALSNANERGNAAAIQRAETRLSNANERLDSHFLKKDDATTTAGQHGQPIHVHVNFGDGSITPVVHNHMPEHGEHTVNVHVPEQAAPVVHNHVEAAPAPEVHNHHEIHVEHPPARSVRVETAEDGSKRYVPE